MPAAPILTRVDVATSPLNHLQTAPPAVRSALNDALDTALKAQLTAAFSDPRLPTLSELAAKLPAADIAAASRLSVRTFLTEQLAPLTLGDATLQTALDAELAQVSDSTTIGDLLQLNQPLDGNPLLRPFALQSRLASLLATTPGVGPDLQSRFIQLYSTFAGQIGDFWKHLGSDPALAAQVPALQFTLQLGALTLNNPALVAALRAARQPSSVRDLTALTDADWAQLIASDGVVIPDAVPGATAAERAANYGLAMQAVLRAAFASDYLVQVLERASVDATDIAVADFLRTAPEFHLTRTNLANHLAANTAALDGIMAADRPALIQRLSSYQRLSRLGVDPEQMTPLVTRHMDSAYQVASLPRNSFLRQYSAVLGGSAAALQVHAKAQRTTASSINFLTTVREGLDPFHPRVFGTVAQDVATAVQQIPTWQELFGPTSTCACGECRSVLSAAAYLADLLQTLSTWRVDPGNPDGDTLFSILSGRRPDIANLKLNCENINTTLPYLDLVNEILETVVASAVGATPTLAAYDTSPEATSEELAVNPEHTNDVAYLPLESAYFPLTLPFDRAILITRSYLEFAGTSLQGVMQAFQQADAGGAASPSELRIALEYLGISQSEYLILTGQPFSGTTPQASAAELSRYYGYQPPLPPADWVDDLAKVPNFLSRTGVSYAELIALIETHVLNPSQSMTLQSSDAARACDITTTVIANLVPGNVVPPDLTAVRLCHRFIRLYRKLGWSVGDLDRAMSLLGATDIDDGLLRRLSDLKWLQDQLDLSIPEVLALWADLDTEGPDSLYVSLFQNRGTRNPVDPAFTLRHTASLPANSTLDLSILNPHAAHIAYAAGQLTLTDGNGNAMRLTNDQRRFLLAASPDPAYRLAVTELFVGNPATLAALPAGFTLPAELPDAVYAQGNNLVMVGSLSKERYATLKGLSTDDGWQLALDILFALRRAPGTDVALTTQLMSDHIGTLCAALRVSAADVAAILTYLWGSTTTPLITVATLSAVYRPVRLAQALGIGVPDLITFIDLIGIDPATAATVALVTRVRDVLASPFSAAQLDYVYRNVPSPNAPGPEPADLRQFVADVQAALARQTATTARVTDPAGTLLAQYLHKVLDGADATQMLAILDGSSVFTATLPALPAIALPADLAGQVTYAGQQLTVMGPLSPGQLSSLLAASPDSAYRAAVQALFQAGAAARAVTYQSSPSPAPLPAVTFPAAFTGTPSRIAIDAARTVISFTGPMTAAEETQLLAVAADPDYQSAIQNLYAQGAAARATSYTQPLPGLPPIELPALSRPTTYDSGAARLAVTGHLSAADEIALLTVSSDAAYQAAVETLADGPRRFIRSRFHYLDPEALIAALLQDASPTADTYGTLLNALSSAINAVIDTLRDTLPLDAATLRTLLVGGTSPPTDAVLRSAVDPALAAIADFFALVGSGLSAIYFPLPNHAGTAVTGIAPDIDFDWSGSASPAPGFDPATWSATWSGQVMAPTTESYTLHARLSPAPPSGTVTVSGANLTGLTGASFDPSWTGATLCIVGGAYVIQSVAGPTALTLASAPTPQGGPLSFSVAPVVLTLGGARLVLTAAPGLAATAQGELLATVNLQAGELTTLEVDYPNAWVNPLTGLQLSWSSQSTPPGIIPQQQLYPSTFALDPPLATYGLLSRLAPLLTGLRLTADDLTFFAAHPTMVEGVNPNDPADVAPFDLNALPARPTSYRACYFDQWERLRALVALRDSLPGKDAGLLDVFTLAQTVPPPSLPTLMAQITAATGWDPAELAVLVGSSADPMTNTAIGFNLAVADFRDERWLLRLQACLSLAGRFGVSVRQLFEWAAVDSTAGLASTNGIARDVQSAVAARFDAAAWTRVGKSLNDGLRDASRKALISFLLANQGAWQLGAPIADTDQLYGYYLIDVDMGACMQTSRVVQAAAAVQLFVQRCLMNLEPGISPAAIDSSLWSWMKNYRVWQANREVFLYPENYMDPTLRDDKTPFFRDLETELQQNPLTSETAVQALLHYLEQLDQAARLDLCATYYQWVDPSPGFVDGTRDATNDVLHVIGRTAATPHVYYYRRLVNASRFAQGDGASTWTAWEPVNVDIQGDHLIPVFWNGHLYLFWPIFSEASDATKPAAIPGPTGKQAHIQLAWSQYGHGSWSSKQVSTDYVVPRYIPSDLGMVTLDGTTKVVWLSGSPFSAGFAGLQIIIGNQTFTVQSVESAASLTLTSAPTGLQTGSQDYNLVGGSFSPDYTGTLDPTWFTFSSRILPSGELSIGVFIPAIRTLEQTTYSPDQPPTLSSWGDPQQSAGTIGEFTLSGCGADVVATSITTGGYFLFRMLPLVIPANSVYNYQRLQEIDAYPNPVNPDPTDGTLTIPFVESGQAVQTTVLQATPTPYQLICRSPPFDIHLSLSNLGLYVDGFQPFFYQDGRRSFFVAPLEIDVQEIIFSLGSARPAFSAAALTTPAWAATAVDSTPLILKGAAAIPSAATPIAVPTPIIVRGPPIETFSSVVDTTRELEFAPFWHPHVCKFIKTLTQYGLPSMFSLTTQRVGNDGGVVSGFELYVPGGPQNPVVGLTAGTLYARGLLYQTPVASAPAVPAINDQVNRTQYLYCDPSGTLYYEPTQAPQTAGDALIGRVDTDGAGTIVAVTQGSALSQSTVFGQTYQPTARVARPYPGEGVDFSFGGAYSVYNWEVFFHIPLLIATQLSQNQQFEAARQWFEFIFNPTTTSTDAIPQRYWNFQPFHDCSVADEITGSIEGQLLALDTPRISSISPIAGPQGTWVSIEGGNFAAYQGTSSVAFAGTAASIIDWTETRLTVIVPIGAASGNVVASIATSTTLGGVVTATTLQSNGVPFTVDATVVTPASPECGLDVRSQVARWLQTPFDPFAIGRTRTIAFRKMVVMKYLDNLIAWGDYLFAQNQRESINEAIQIYLLARDILGARPLILPARGVGLDYSYNDLAALGLDSFSNALVSLENTFPFSTGADTAMSSSVGTPVSLTHQFYFCLSSNDQVSGYWDTVDDRLTKIRNCMNAQGVVQRLPLFSPPINPLLLVRAAALGVDIGSVLNAIETPLPGYRFSVMLQKALELCGEVRALGTALLSALEKKDAEGMSVLRATQERDLLQSTLQVRQAQLEEANANLAALQASQAMTQFRQQHYQRLLTAGLSAFESTQTTELTSSQQYQLISQALDLESGLMALVPNITVGIEGELSSPVSTITFGGIDLQASLAAASRAINMLSSFHAYSANMASIMGSWDRRSQDWDFQAQAAGKELAQIQSQIDAANVRVQIAQEDLQNQGLQISHAQAVLDFLGGKYTNQELYGWMCGQSSALYFRCYQMAYGLAKRAEACLRNELALGDSNYIQFGYWDSLRKGLLAGERLYADLKKMENAYFDQNRRGYEISKFVSLVLLDPLALIALKESGACAVSLPEALFDLDYPGHYLRQIKSLSLTIPCVTGPYTSVNCRLTLVSSRIRIDATAASVQDYAQDSHFMLNFAAQSIATSTAQNDSGLFEVNFRDERYLPFEGAGVISQWLIELPADCNTFDFETISDVVINLKYTAREGGDGLRAVARQAAVLPGPADQSSVSHGAVKSRAQPNLSRSFSLKHEFPSEWYRFLAPQSGDADQSLLLDLTHERFPYQYRGRKISVTQLGLLLKFKDVHDTTRFRSGTPLGDFQAGATPGVLNVYVSQAPVSRGPTPLPPATPTSVAPLGLSSTSDFGGTPWATGSVALNLGSWWVQVFTTGTLIGSVASTLLDANGHLLPDVVEDVIIVAQYSAAAA